MAVLDGRDGPCPNCLLVVENRYVGVTQGRPEIKYLLQKGMSGKRSLLTHPQGPSRYFINMENSELSTVSLVETIPHEHVPQDRHQVRNR